MFISMLFNKSSIIASATSEDGVCFISLCHRAFSKKIAFSYLEDIKKEFFKLYSEQIKIAKRPYCFVEF
ncbi:hypothetical protein MXB_4615, partial [Myxobolus squamalis]